MNRNKFNLSIKDITLIAALSSFLFIQELVLSFLPNIQLTMLLIFLFSKKLGCFKTIFINLVYVLLDNIFNGSFNLLFVVFMFIGWSIVPILLNTIFNKVNNNILLSLLGILFSFLYSWVLIIPGCIVFNTDIISYLKMDITWEVVMATSSFLTILFIYEPLFKLFDKILFLKEDKYIQS